MRFSDLQPVLVRYDLITPKQITLMLTPIFFQNIVSRELRLGNIKYEPFFLLHTPQSITYILLLLESVGRCTNQRTYMQTSQKSTRRGIRVRSITQEKP